MSDTYRHKEKGRIKNTPSNNTIVQLEQEYGYRYYVWHTGMSEQELISYWEGIEDIDYFGINNLPGKLKPFCIYEDITLPTKWRAHYHENSDSYLKWEDFENKIFKQYLHKKAGSSD